MLENDASKAWGVRGDPSTRPFHPESPIRTRRSYEESDMPRFKPGNIVVRRVTIAAIILVPAVASSRLTVSADLTDDLKMVIANR